MRSGCPFSWTLNTTSFTVDAVLDQLRARNTTIIYDSAGSVDYSEGFLNLKYLFLKPLIKIGEVLRGTTSAIDMKALGISFGYLIIGFWTYESIRFGIKKIIQKRQEKTFTGNFR